MNFFKTGFAFLFFAVFLICACGRSPEYSPYGEAPALQKSAAYDTAQADGSIMFESGGSASNRARNGSPSSGDPSNNAGSIVQTRKLVKRASLRLRAEDPAGTEKPLADLMEKYGAWPASSYIYENSRDYSLRVPSPNYDAMLEELAGLGRPLRRTETAEDVTLHYYDLESRLATKRELLKTFQNYLGRAKNIEEILSVENRIAELQREIEYTGTQLRNLSNLIDYCTIELEIVGPPSAAPGSRTTLGEKLGGLLGSFGDVVSTVFVVLAGIVIYGVPGIIILILLFWLLFGRIGLIKKIWRMAAGKH